MKKQVDASSYTIPRDTTPEHLEIHRCGQCLQRIALWPAISASRSVIDQNPI